MINHSFRTAGLLLVLATIVSVGCNSSARPASPELARATLQQAMDAWKTGETPDLLRNRSSITVVELKWREGFRLLNYEIVGDAVASGFDCQCKVRLTLQKPSGKKSQESGVYSISTSPALVIVRAES